MKRLRLVRMILLMTVVLAMIFTFCSSTLADEEKEQRYPHRYIGGVTWVPMDNEIWDPSYTLRYFSQHERTYMTGVIGIARVGNVYLQKDSTLKDAENKTFAGIGFGTNLTKSDNNRLFVGVGATLYWVESGDGGEGWKYVDSSLHVLGPAHDEKVFVSPEISAHYWFSRKIGLYVCANLSSEGQPPKDGIFFGISIR